MKKYIRALRLLIVVPLLTVMLAGCGGSGSGTVPAPSDGWTKAELMNVTYVAGCRLSSPPVYGDFKSKAKINEEYTVEGEDYVRKFVYYKGEIFIDLTYRRENEKTDITDISPIDGMYLKREFNKADSQIRINGITLGSSKENVVKALGEPDEWRMKNTVADYKFKDGGYMTLDFEAGMLYSISIHGLSSYKDK